MRINIVGSAGAGKSVLANALATKLACPHIELDALYWGPKWTEAEPDEFRTRVAVAIQPERWVADGNYGSKIRDLLWARATTVVWLDYPLPLILWRLVCRSLRRSLMGEQLWHGNRETVWGQFFAKDALVRYVIRTHKRRRDHMVVATRDPAYAHIDFVRLSTPVAMTTWLEKEVSHQ